jgi:hypothetical protein
MVIVNLNVEEELNDLEIYRWSLGGAVKVLEDFATGWQDIHLGIENLIEQRCKLQGRGSCGKDY